MSNDFSLRYPSPKGPVSRFAFAPLSTLKHWIRAELAPTLVVTDSKVGKLQEKLLKNLMKHRTVLGVVRVPQGEKAKTFAHLQRILAAANRLGLPRNGRMLAIGGGCVGDLTGFAAAVHLRGVSFWNAPTTLLSMVDSAAGGKVAINTPEGKNLVGAFHQPDWVLLDTAQLQTLPRPQIMSGWAEMLKAALLFSPPFWNRLEAAGDPCTLEGGAMNGLIKTSLKAKGKVVIEDEKEAGKRALLNLGHTVAHGLEHCSGFNLSHGLAVGAGLMVETRMARLLGLMPATEEENILSSLKRWGYHRPLRAVDPDELLKPMARDKKAVGRGIPFVFLSAIGKPVPAGKGWVQHLRAARTRALLVKAFQEGF